MRSELQATAKLDFDNAFNSVDDKALWRWLQETRMNVSDVEMGLRSPARGLADDLVLCTQSAAEMNCLMTVVSNFGL